MKFFFAAIILLLQSSFINATSRRKTVKKAVDSDPDNNMTHFDIFSRIFKPRPAAAPHLANLSIISPTLPFIPQEIWIHVLMNLHHLDIWSFGLVCKWTASLVRDDQIGFPSIWAGPQELGELLLESELSLHSWMKNAIIDRLHQISHDASIHGIVQETGQSITQLRNFLLERSADPKFSFLVVKAIGRFSVITLFHDQLGEHLYDGEFHGAKLYLPPKDGIKLFDRVDPRLMACNCYSSWFGSTDIFSIALLVDYVLPSIDNVTILSPNELKLLQFFAPLQAKGLHSYMELLLWAIFYSTGEVRKTERTVTKRVVEHFTILGFDWYDLCKGTPTLKSYQSAQANQGHRIEAIYIVAKQWGLNLVKIANGSSFYPLSQDILAGNIPDFLQDNRTYSCQEMYNISCGRPIVRPFNPHKRSIGFVEGPAQKRLKIMDNYVDNSADDRSAFDPLELELAEFQSKLDASIAEQLPENHSTQYTEEDLGINFASNDELMTIIEEKFCALEGLISQSQDPIIDSGSWLGSLRGLKMTLFGNNSGNRSTQPDSHNELRFERGPTLSQLNAPSSVISNDEEIGLNQIPSVHWDANSTTPSSSRF